MKLATATLIFIILISGCSTSSNDGLNSSQRVISITAIQPTAWEYSATDDYLEFVIELGSPNETSGNIRVYFSVSGSALSRPDIVGAPSLQNEYVEIPPGLQTASIKIEGITGNSTVEETKTVIITLTGCSSADFSIGSQSSATAIIMDGDGPTVTDIDGNVYHTVKIGAQTWMVENLRTTHYNDGTDIPLVTDDIAWEALTTPGYCWYNNDQATYGSTYGALYNWYAVNTGKLCPTGWRVATDAEWTQLTDYLGGESFAGSILKEFGTWHWYRPNTGATNSSGFTALPGGRRHTVGNFYGLTYYALFWSSTERSPTNAWYRHLHYNTVVVGRNGNYKTYGLSVRCLQD